jgi:large repetitive protein
VTVIRGFASLLLALIFPGVLLAQSQGNQSGPGAPTAEDRDYGRKRSEWFARGRILPGLPSAELRRRAYAAKMKMRAPSVAPRLAGSNPELLGAGSWIPLGPVPLASDASGSGLQDYRQVAGRVTAVAIDPADPTGNTVYIGAAQGGVWKSTNAVYGVANNVAWTPLTDSQATLSIGAIAIQEQQIPDATKSVILAATGEANNSADSYFGLGILRSADAGSTWTLVSTANNGALCSMGWAERAWHSRARPTWSYPRWPRVLRV